MIVYLDVNSISSYKDNIFIDSDILITINKLRDYDIKVVLSPYFEKYLIKYKDYIIPVNEMGRRLLNQFKEYNITVSDINLIDNNCIIFKKEEDKTLKLGEFTWK